MIPEIQTAVRDRLAIDPYFDSMIPVFLECDESDDPDTFDLAENVHNALAEHGIACIICSPSFELDNGNCNFQTARFTVSIIEDPRKNRATDDGSGIAANKAARKAIALLQHFQPDIASSEIQWNGTPAATFGGGLILVEPEFTLSVHTDILITVLGNQYGGMFVNENNERILS